MVPLLDLIVVGIVVISALLAAVRGFTREVLAIGAWAAAAIAALLLFPRLQPIVGEHIAQPIIAQVVSIAAIFLVTLVVVSFITVRISDIVLDSRIGALDRTLGFLFGAARGVLICVAGYIFFNWLLPPDRQPDWAKNAKTKTFLLSTGEQLQAMLPDNLEGLITEFRNKRKLGGDGADPPSEDSPTPKSPPRGNRT